MPAPSETGHATGEEDGPGLTDERSFLVRCSIVCLANVYASDQHRAGGRARIDEPDRSDQTSDPASVARERSGALVVSKAVPAQSASRPGSRTDQGLMRLGSVRLAPREGSSCMASNGPREGPIVETPTHEPGREETGDRAFVNKKFSRSLVSRP